MSKTAALVGKEAVLEVIQESYYKQFRIHASKPVDKTQLDIIKSCNTLRTKEQAVSAFNAWADSYLKHSANPSQLFYLELAEFNKLGRKSTRDVKNLIPEIIPFKLVADKEKEAPEESIGSMDINQLVEAKVENARLQWELDQLRAEQLEDEEDEEDEEDQGSLFGLDLNTPIGQALGKVILSVAEKYSAPAGASPLISAFEQLKKINPRTEEIVIKLSEFSRRDPESLKSFLDNVYTGLIEYEQQAQQKANEKKSI